MEIKRASLKSADSGFSDIWYTSAAPGGELSPALAYDQLGIAARAVDILANAAAGIPYSVMRGERDVSENVPLNWNERLNQVVTDFVVFGAFYVLPEKVGGVETLRRFLPSTVRPVYEGGRVVRFERTGPGGMTERYDADELIWKWEQNVLSDSGPGTSMLGKALTEASIINASGQFTRAWLMRGGPITLLKGKNVRAEDREKMELWWNKVTSGMRSWFKGILINADLIEPVSFGGDMKTGDTDKTKRSAEEALCAELGIPLSIVFANSATLATGAQDERNLINYSAEPLAVRCLAPFNERLFMPRGLTYELHKERMSAFEETLYSQVDAITKLIDAGLVTTQYAQADLLSLPVTPKRIETEEQIDTQGAATPQRVDIPAQVWVANADKAMWLAKSLRSLGKGRGASVPFISDAISAADHARITDALKSCATPEAVRAVFVAAPAVVPVADNSAWLLLAAEIKAAREALANEQPNINIYNQPPSVSVAAPEVRAEFAMPAQAAPSIIVNVPEQAAPAAVDTPPIRANLIL